MLDPDLLLEPERLGIQMLIPTPGAFIHFKSGLILQRGGNLQSNPVELQDRAMAEREKKIKMYEHILKMDQDMNIPIEHLNKKSVFDIYTKTSKPSGPGGQKIKRETIIKHLEEERKILNQIKDGTYDLNFKASKTKSTKYPDSPSQEPQTGKIVPSKKLLSVFEMHSGPMHSQKKLSGQTKIAK